MPMPKKDTVQRTIRISRDLSEKLDNLLKDPVTGRTMFGGFSHVASEAIERLLKSHWWKTRLKSLRALPPDLQLEVEVRCGKITEFKTLDIFATKQPGTPGSQDQPAVDEMLLVDEMLIGELSVQDQFPEIQKYAERLLNEEKEK